jgi:hypothetical protein
MHTAGGEAAEELFSPAASPHNQAPGAPRGGSATRSMNNIASLKSWL